MYVQHSARALEGGLFEKDLGNRTFVVAMMPPPSKHALIRQAEAEVS